MDMCVLEFVLAGVSNEALGNRMSVMTEMSLRAHCTVQTTSRMGLEFNVSSVAEKLHF